MEKSTYAAWLSLFSRGERLHTAVKKNPFQITDFTEQG